MTAKEIEKAYEKRLCKDYELLYDFVTKGFNLICCLNLEEKIRKVYQVKTDCYFDGLYLAFIDEKGANRKKLFTQFCKQTDLSFILP
jgi:hypothetical protein